MTTTQNLIYSASKTGEQHPEAFQAGPNDTLITSFTSGIEAKGSGASSLNVKEYTGHNAAPVEIKARVAGNVSSSRTKELVRGAHPSLCPTHQLPASSIYAVTEDVDARACRAIPRDQQSTSLELNRPSAAEPAKAGEVRSSLRSG